MQLAFFFFSAGLASLVAGMAVAAPTPVTVGSAMFCFLNAVRMAINTRDR